MSKLSHTDAATYGSSPLRAEYRAWAALDGIRRHLGGRGAAMTEQEWTTSADPAAMLQALRLDGGQRLAGEPFQASDRKLVLFVAACIRTYGECGIVSVGPADELESLADRGDEAIRRKCYPAGLARSLAEALPDSGGVAALLKCIFGTPWKREHGCRCDPEVGASPCEWCDLVRGKPRSIATAIYEERRFEDVGVLADALEEAGCGDEVCPNCEGTGVCGLSRRAGVTKPVWGHECGRCPDNKGRLPNLILAHLRATIPCTRCWLLQGVRVVSEDGRPHSIGPCRRCDCRDGRRPTVHVRGCWATDLILGKS